MDTQQTIPNLCKESLAYLANDIGILELINTLKNHQSIKHLETCLNYQFKDYSLLLEALVHRSFAHEFAKNIKHNERLEFLGDAILDLAVGKEIYKRLPEAQEGEMSKLRSSIVNEQTLATLAIEFQIHNLILLGKGEFNRNGQNNSSSLADLLEAIFGAIVIDFNELQAMKSINNLLEKSKINFFTLERLELFDPKTSLQEYCLKHFSETPKYVGREAGKEFKIGLYIQDRLIEEQKGKSKKRAEIELAKKVLENKESYFKKFNQEFSDVN